MNKDFIDLILSMEDELYKLTEKEQKKIYKAHKKDFDDILSLISKSIISHSVVDNVLNVKLLEKRSLKKSFNKDISKLIKTQYDREKGFTNEILKNSGKNKHSMNSYIFSLDIKKNYKLKKLSDEKLKSIIGYKIKNELWSDRVWKNKKILEKQLKKEMFRIIDGKTDINKIEKTIRRKFNQDAHRTRRLVRTEVARVQNEVNEVWAKEHKIKQQMFMATLDLKTSTICSDNDGNVFNLDDINKPVPPLHPNCRSVLVNMPYEDWKPSVRIDNITKQNVNYSTYKEWLKNK